MPRRSLQFPTQCYEQDCVLYVGQFRVQIMWQSGSDFAANQHGSFCMQNDPDQRRISNENQ